MCEWRSIITIYFDISLCIPLYWILRGGLVARIFVGDARIRKLVGELIPLVVDAESVNKLCERLNGALAASGFEGSVYPNRLHALLSEDPARALNEASVDLIERA